MENKGVAGLRLITGVCFEAIVAAAQQPTFKSGTRVVPIYATVRGRSNEHSACSCPKAAGAS